MFALYKTFLNAFIRNRTSTTVINDLPFAVRMIFQCIAREMETELMQAVKSEIEISISTATNTDRVQYTVHGKLDDVEMNGGGWVAQPEFTFEIVEFVGQHYVKGTFDTAMFIIRSMKLQPVGE